MALLEILILAVASAFWPVLVAVDLIALRTPRPARLLAWFLVGGLVTTVGVGLVIVFALEGTTLATPSRRHVGAWTNLVAGLAALALAWGLRARAERHRRRPEPATPQGSPRWAQSLERGGAYAVAAGVVLNILPGVFPFLALRDIAALGYGDATKVALVVGFYLIMFTLVEAPLAGLLLAPERAELQVRRLNAWLDRNGKRLGIDVLAVIGLLLIVRGVVQILVS